MKKLLCIFIFFNLCSNPVFLQTTDTIAREQLSKSMERISHLEQEVKVYQDFFPSIEGIVSLIGLIALVITIIGSGSYWYFQNKEEKLAQKLQSKYENSFREQAQNNRELMGAVKDNILSTTEFIRSYESLIKLKTDAGQQQELLEKLLNANEAQEANLIKNQQDLNAKAMRVTISELFGDKNFSSTYFNNIVKDNIRTVTNPAVVLLFNHDERARAKLNGNVYLLEGLKHFLNAQMVDAAINLEEGLKRAQSIDANMRGEDLMVLLPERSILHAFGGPLKWTEHTINKCAFFRALTFYRQGDWEKSLRLLSDGH